MFIKRPAHQRGHGNFGWLESRHTFSFGDYRDETHMGFRSLRVINEDRVQPNMGFPMHPHRDMEIVTYVLSGELKHEDSLGHSGLIQAGEVQRITAGHGIFHSEFNPSDAEAVHFYQIWLLPNARGLKPGYDQRSVAETGKVQLIASSDGRDRSLTINRDASIFVLKLDSGERYTYELPANRHAWIQVVRGDLDVNHLDLKAGDGLAVSLETRLEFSALHEAEVILFDLD